VPSYNPGTLNKYSFPGTTTVLSAGIVTQVCQGNARRIALGLFSTNADMRIFPTSMGVLMSQISPNLATSGGFWYLASETGPLCQLEWYGYSVSGGSVTTLEVVEES
jgi:hypothetical protein